MNAYSVVIPVFTGPLDLLLHLIERNELDITAVSLVQVTEQYLSQIEDYKGERVEELIEFLSIGARLLLIKSRALLPRPAVMPDTEEEEEDPAEVLLRQLRSYRRFKEAAAWLDVRQQSGQRTYLRVAPPPQIEGKPDLTGVTVQTLRSLMLQVLMHQEALTESLDVARPNVVTIEQQIGHLRERLGTRTPFYFRELLAGTAGNSEVAVTLLALLELIKRREAKAEQSHLFGPILIEATEGTRPMGA